MKGLLTIQFSDKVVIPQNYTLFNDQFMRLKIINGDENGLAKNLSAWKITAFRDFEMDIQLNFTDPLSISAALVNQLVIVICIIEKRLD